MVPQTVGTSSSGISGSSFSAQNEQRKVGIASRAPAVQQNTNPVQNPFTAGNSTNPQTKIAEKKQTKLGDLSPLVFPPELSPEYYICFNAFKHSQTRPQELKRKFSFSKSVYLPLPTNISDSYSAGYNAENLYIGGEAMRRGFNAVTQKDGTSSISNMLDNVSSVETAARAAAGALEVVANDPTGTAQKAIAGAAVLAMSSGSGPLTSAARASFQVSTNPFPVMIFQGTTFKPPFSFDWVFYPESLEEAQAIRKIVGYFRREMLPELLEGNESILKTPAIFEIEMKPNEYTRQFKKCVLKDMAVNYAPNGPSFIISDDNEVNSTRVPSAVSLSLTFQEIEVWLADDFYEDEYNSFGFRNKAQDAATAAAAANRPPNTNAMGVPQQSDSARAASSGIPGIV